MSSLHNKKRERPYDSEDDHQPNNEVRLGVQHKKQQPTRTPLFSISPHSEGGTSNSNVTTKLRSTSRELEYPLKSDISVTLLVENGEYNLKLTSVPTDNKMTNHAHTAAMLLSQGELLCKLGHKLLSDLGAHHESKTYRILDL
ncbi:uncharacterized protein LOC123889996 [Trifolium pratense]|uniref:uncharacterized protein LOC123889996 n=1 Tax=Trifolium pratense TaxID=57577 RepID=UPI001E695359|nr:uncharacterized protein LOC123889996 [Trifolium pratense]